MRRRIQCAGLLALAVLGGSCLGCCCDKQGYVLHGSWTLGMQRQPCAAGCAPAGCGCQDQGPSGAPSGAPACALKRRGGHGSAAAEQGPLVAGPGHFHPVPTSPVFGPRPDMMAVPTGAPGELSPGEMPDSELLPVPDKPGNSARRPSRRITQAIASSFAVPASGQEPASSQETEDDE